MSGIYLEITRWKEPTFSQGGQKLRANPRVRRSQSWFMPPSKFINIQSSKRKGTHQNFVYASIWKWGEILELMTWTATLVNSMEAVYCNKATCSKKGIESFYWRILNRMIIKNITWGNEKALSKHCVRLTGIGKRQCTSEQMWLFWTGLVFSRKLWRPILICCLRNRNGSLLRFYLLSFKSPAGTDLLLEKRQQPLYTVCTACTIL